MEQVEREKFDDLIKFNEIALKQYEQLAELEIQGKKQSSEYQNIINNLKLIADVIAKKLSSLNITAKELLDYDSELAKKYNFDDDDILVGTLLQSNNDLAAKRLSMQIYNYSLINYCYCLEDVYIDEAYSGNMDEIDDIIDEDVANEMDFHLIKDRLTNHTFLAYLEEAIKKETNETVKNILIKTKYHVIYLIYSIEVNFLKNQKRYVNPKVIQEIITNHEEKVDIDEEFIIPNESTIIEYLECIADFPNKFYDSIENNVKAYLLSIYIKTLISINISKPTDANLKTLRENLELKSEKSRKYINEAYKISKKLSVVKKVDF